MDNLSVGDPSVDDLSVDDLYADDLSVHDPSVRDAKRSLYFRPSGVPVPTYFRIPINRYGVF